MQSIVELVVSGNTSGATVVGGSLDLFGDEEINVVLSVKDVRDIASTTSSYSQTFKIPGTKNNNLIFQNLFLVGADGTFDPRKRANCFLTVDSETIIEGTLQVVNIDIDDRDKPTYGVTVFGVVKDFNSRIKGKYLTDYDWSELNHILNVPNVVNTWSSSTALGYYYSIKDYGYDYTMTGVKGSSTKEGIPIGNMYPDIYNKYIIDKIFSAAGYTYASSLFSSTTFSQTVTPFNGDTNTIMGTDYVSGRTFTAIESTLSSITFNNMRHLSLTEAIQPYEYAFERRIRANSIVSGSVVGANYTQATNPGDKYTFDQPGISSFSVGINYEYFALPNCMRGQIGCRFYRSSYNGGTTPFHEELSASEVAGTGFYIFSTPICNNTNGPNTLGGQAYRPFDAGEQVWASLYIRVNMGYAPPTMTDIPFKITSGGFYWSHYPSAQRTTGQVVNMNNVIPKNVLVTDYLKSIFNLFNAYVEPVKNTNNRMYIEDFESFYAAGTQRDWSTKLDRSQKITETLVSEELAKKYTFSYKDDSDWLNVDYKNNVKRTYGDLIYDVDNEFITNEEKIEVIFSPTPVDNVIGSNRFVVPKIGKYDSNGKFNKTNFNIRFLRKNSTLKPLGAGEYFRFTGTTTYTSYPYAGHLDDAFASTIDYNFGAVPYVYYPWSAVTNNSITNNNLVNLYWKKYLDEVTDKEARLITAYFKLSPSDIATFRFADTVYVDGISSEGGHIYRVNSITYTANSNKPAKVELIKVLTKYITKYPSRYTLFTGVGTGVGSINLGFTLGNAFVSHGTSIGIGNGTYVNSPNSFALGTDNILNGAGSNMIVGNENFINPANTGATIFGTGNLIDVNGHDSTVIGNFNYVVSGSTANYVRGNYNTVVLGDTISIQGNNNIVNSAVTGYASAYLNIVGNGNSSLGQATGVTISGNYNIISAGTIDLNIYGHSNSATTGMSGITINGNLNTLQGSNSGITIFGDGNVVKSGSKNIVINGLNNTISANTTNVTILGMNNLSTTLSDTVYTPNVSVNNTFILATGSTIEMGGGVVVGTLGTALGSGVTVDSGGSFGIGVGSLTEVTMVGEFAMASQGNYGQAGTVILQNRTTGATTRELFTDIPSTQRFTIQSGASYYVRLFASATDQYTQDSITYKGEGLIKNKSGVTTLTEMVLMSVSSYDSYISATTLTVSADTINNALAVTASGQTGTIINWLCQVDYTRVNQFI